MKTFQIIFLCNGRAKSCNMKSFDKDAAIIGWRTWAAQQQQNISFQSCREI